MFQRKMYVASEDFDVDKVQFHLIDKNGKSTVAIGYGENLSTVAIVTPVAVTQWPRVNGDGNYGTMFGPAEKLKARYTLDLSDIPIKSEDSENPFFEEFKAKLQKLDDKLLDFVCQNQLRLLGRKNLKPEEVKMLQNPSIRAKYDKMTGNLQEYTFNVSCPKYIAKTSRTVPICDHTGKVIPNGVVASGDVVRATVYISHVYTGAGGDKFGINWGFDEVSIVCQRIKLQEKSAVPVFGNVEYCFSADYTDFSESSMLDEQTSSNCFQSQFGD